MSKLTKHGSFPNFVQNKFDMEMKNKALLVMDVENAVVQNIDNTGPLFSNLKKAISKARNNEIPVIYVKVGFRKGYPEISPNNKRFSSLKKSGAGLDSPKASEIIPELAPKDGDVVITKKRFSAFTGSDLEVVLRGKQIDDITLTGISTSGVVLSTLREAADKDFKINVLSDCCADHDAEVHSVLLKKVFPVQAEVMPVAQWQKNCPS